MARAARHHHHRRRRARAGALPVQAARPRDGLLRRQPAQVAARADRHRTALRRARIASRRPGRCRRRPSGTTTTSASSRKSAPVPAATKAAINEAIAFHQAIGIERKAARLRYLTLRWANELKKHPKIKLHSSLEPGQTWGLAVVSIDGVDSDKLVDAPVGQVPHRHRGCRA